MFKKNCLYFVCISSVFLLSACGQMGPLYLPDQKPPIYIPHHFGKSNS